MQRSVVARGRLTFTTGAAFLLSVAIVAAACGSSNTTPDPGSASVAPSATVAPTVEPSVGPVEGGTLVYGIQSDGTSGFNPTQDALGPSGQLIMRAIYEPLVIDDSEGGLSPYLAASVTPDAALTTWTITLRAGITFSDGAPLDADTVVQNLEAYRVSANYGSLFGAVDTITATAVDTVTIGLKTPSSALLDALILPMLSPKTIAVAGAGAGVAIGTGPFVLTEWAADAGGKAERNETYWRTGLPYLDSVEFRILGSEEATTAAMESGEIDAFNTNQPTLLARFTGKEGFQVTTSSAIAPTGMVLLNPEVPALADLAVRTALSQAIDRDAIVALIGEGIVEAASGPFAPGKPGYLDDAGIPGYDLAAATTAITAWEAANGALAIKLEHTPDGQQLAELIQDQWRQAGVDVTLESKEPTPAIIDALTGAYEALVGSMPGVSRAVDYKAFMHSSNLHPVGEFSTDYIRVNDPAVDAALEALDATNDPVAIKAAAEDLNRALGKGVAAIWTYWFTNGVVAKDTVHDLTGVDLPDGGRSIPMREGAHEMTGAWISR